jgi:serine/threonine protein kinase
VSDKSTSSRGGSSVTDKMIGRILDDRFEIKEYLARGGMGRIYLAEQRPLGRQVVVKVLDVKSERAEEFRRRFFLEASLCSRLSHPNIVRIFDYGCDNKDYFIAMEYLKGKTLHQVIRESSPMDPLRVIHLMKQVCAALEESHANGIIHRDLKPANLFVTEHGIRGEFVKLMDFGLVKDLQLAAEVTQTGHALGSPLYMSPEQITGEAVDPRTDIYALGVILFIMLTGKRPYKKGSPMQVMMSQLHDPPPSFSDINPKIETNKNLETLAKASMQKAKDDRLLSSVELHRGLRACELELLGDLSSPLVLRVENGRIKISDEVEALLSETGWTVKTGNFVPEREEAPEIQGVETFYSTAGVPRTASALRPWQVVIAFLALLSGLLIILTTMVVALFVGTMATPVARLPASTMAPAIGSGLVLIDSKPSGAELEYEDAYLGKTPFELKLEQGEAWTIKLSKSGYEERSFRVTWETGEITVPMTALGEEAPAE